MLFLPTRSDQYISDPLDVERIVIAIINIGSKNNSNANKQNADQTKKVQESIKGLQNEIAILELKRKGGTDAMIEALKIDQQGLNLNKEQMETIGQLILKKHDSIDTDGVEHCTATKDAEHGPKREEQRT